MRSMHWLFWSATGLAMIGCGSKPPESAASAPAASDASSAPATAPAPPAEAPPVAVITAVHPQWIISDGLPKVEIALFGENLADAARVSSSSSQAVVERVDADPGRTLVTVAMDASAPPGMYDFQYEAPGQPPIPFSIEYAAPK